MTIAVDLRRKESNQTNIIFVRCFLLRSVVWCFLLRSVVFRILYFLCLSVFLDKES